MRCGMRRLRQLPLTNIEWLEKGTSAAGFGAGVPFPAKGGNMLWTIFVVLVVMWLLGFSFHVAGGLIHILLVVALIILVINLVSGRRGIL